MRSRAAVILAMALALPALGQRSATHGGFSGQLGSSPHAGPTGRGGPTGPGGFSGRVGSLGYSGLVGIQRPSSFMPAGRLPSPPRLVPPARNGVSLPYGGRGFSGGRYPNRPGYPNRYPHRDPYHDHDHHGHGRYAYGYPYAYPGYYGYAYPYVINPGFYDWSVPDDSEYEQGENASAEAEQPGPYYPEQPDPVYGAVPYNQQQGGNSQRAPDAARPQIQEYHFANPSTAPSTPSEPLKVILKGKRAPVTMQNYMISSTSLTNLDRGQYQKIPLEQIDIPATEQANRPNGVFFQVPGTSRD